MSSSLQLKLHYTVKIFKKYIQLLNSFGEASEKSNLQHGKKIDQFQVKALFSPAKDL